MLVKDWEWGRAHFETMGYTPLIFFVYHGATSPLSQGLIIFEDSDRNTILCSTPTNEWSPRRRALHLTTLTADKRPWPGGIRTQISAGQRPQTHACVSVCSLCYIGARRTFSALYYIVVHGLSGATEFFHIISYLLLPWSRVLLENVTGPAVRQEISHIFETRKFITVLTSASHLYLSWANSIQSP